MTITLRSAISALLCAAGAAGAAGVAGVAGAQGAAAPACDPGAGQAVAKATLFLQQAAASVTAKQDATKQLKLAITELTTPNKDPKDAADSVGRAYYLGQAYILMLQQAGVPPVAPRSTYGIATDTAATIDLFAAADSAFTTVETAVPGCKTEIAQWREQKPWLDAVNAAINALNAQQFDSAKVYAQRAVTIDRRAPYAFSVLAAVATHNKDYSTATSMQRKAIAAAGADTSYADAKQNAMFDLANTLSLAYDDASATAKDSVGKEAIEAWKSYVATGGNDARVAHAQAFAAQIALALKDTAEYARIYAPVLANTDKYGEQTVLNAGVLATQAGRNDDAVKLFSAVVARNPYQRDALKNLAASYVGDKQPEKVAQVVDKLVAIDPNGASNWLLYAYGYSGMLKDTKDAKATKALTDSLVKYNNKSEKITPNVEIEEFTNDTTNKTVTLGGSLENRGTTAKTYTMDVEFVDKTGTAVGSQTVTVGPVAPKASAPFKATATQVTGVVVGYRYKPIE